MRKVRGHKWSHSACTYVETLLSKHPRCPAKQSQVQTQLLHVKGMPWIKEARHGGKGCEICNRIGISAGVPRTFFEASIEVYFPMPCRDALRCVMTRLVPGRGREKECGQTNSRNRNRLHVRLPRAHGTRRHGLRYAQCTRTQSAACPEYIEAILTS